MENEVVRSALFERLAKAGWITNTWAKEVAPNSVQYRVEYTDHGIKRLGELYSIYKELGLLSSRLGGELNYLCLLAHDWPLWMKQHKPSSRRPPPSE